MRNIFHIRIVARSKGVNRNLCGAQPTSYDITPKNVKAVVKDAEWAPALCEECRHENIFRSMRKRDAGVKRNK